MGSRARKSAQQSSDTAVAEPSSSSTAASKPVSGNSEGLDAKEIDDLLKRPMAASTGPLLETEPLEYTMLRGARSHGNDNTGDEDGADPASERTPLLGSSGDGQDDTASEAPPGNSSGNGNSPFLGGVSVARFWVIFASLQLSFFIACFDMTIMASSHPVITSYFGASNSASWLSTSFMLTSTATQPLLGRLSDAVGRKSPYVITLAIFVVATVWCALAGSMTSFILARAVCGIGAGGMLTLSSIMISDLVPIEIRGTYQSFVNLIFGVASMLGAALGGAMADHLGWRWEFGVQVPPLIAGLLLAVVAVPEDLGLHDKKRETFFEAMRTFDFAGSGLLTVSVAFLIIALNLGGNVIPWSHPLVISSFVISAIAFPLFFFTETRATRPIMPLHLITKTPHSNIMWSNFLMAFLVNAVIFNIPLFFQGVLLTSATSSGLYLVVPALVSSIAGIATGLLISYTRRLKWPLAIGTTVMIGAMALLMSMQRGWPSIAYILSVAPPFISSGLQFPGGFIAVLAVSEQRMQAVVTSTLILWRSIGNVLGIAVSSLVVQGVLAHYLREFVTGDNKDAIIELVRSKVEAVRELEPVAREQAIRAYEIALRWNFAVCAVIAVVGFFIVLPLRLPRLPERK